MKKGMPRFVSVPKVARACGLTTDLLRRLSGEGRLPPLVRIRKRDYFDQAAIEAAFSNLSPARVSPEMAARMADAALGITRRKRGRS